MRSVIAAVVFLITVATASSGAQAGVFTDDLSKCLVNSTSDSDKTVLVIWIYSAMSTHPAIADYSKMTSEQKDLATKKGAGLLVRLMTVDCRSQTVTALRNEGEDALGQSFGVLGKVAMEQLVREPTVQKNLGSLESDFAESVPLKELLKESGVRN